MSDLWDTNSIVSDVDGAVANLGLLPGTGDAAITDTAATTVAGEKPQETTATPGTETATTDTAELASVEKPVETTTDTSTSAPVIPESVKPLVDAVNDLGGLDELQLARDISAPMIGTTIDTSAFLDVLESKRGAAAVDQVAFDFLDLYATSYAEELFAAPDKIITDTPASDPAAYQRQLEMANRIKEFNAWRANGGRATIVATTPSITPTPTVTSPFAVKRPDLDNPDWQIDKELRDYITWIEAQNGQQATANADLDARVKLLEGYRDTSTQTAEQQRQQAQQRYQGEQTGKLVSRIVEPAKNLIAQVKFSTNPNAAQAAQEDQAIRDEISILTESVMDSGRDLITVRGQQMTVLAASNEARRLYIQGDEMGARHLLAALRIQAEQVARRYAQSRQGRIQQALDADASVHASNGSQQRTNVSGPGSGSAAATPIAPVIPKGDPWAQSSLDADIDRYLAGS